MKASILKRIEQLEFRNSPKLNKPLLILRPNDPEPDNPDYYKIIRIVRAEAGETKAAIN